MSGFTISYHIKDVVDQPLFYLFPRTFGGIERNSAQSEAEVGSAIFFSNNPSPQSYLFFFFLKNLQIHLASSFVPLVVPQPSLLRHLKLFPTLPSKGVLI